MTAIRPILDSWRATPFVTSTKVDDRSVGDVLDSEVQIAIRGDGPMSSRELVPLSAGARDLLYGATRDGAQRVLRGVLATMDGVEGASNLRGLSMSSDQAAFATNLLMSNVEAGFFDDAVARGDAAGFADTMRRIAPSAGVAKAQNTGWLDVGPRVSEQLRSVITHGANASSDDATEVALTMLHELQHAHTPPDPNTISDRHVWLEEGIAETLAWWPGRAAALRERMGVPVARGESIDPWSVPPDSVASPQYRNNHRVVQRLLGLAGITPFTDDGAPRLGAYERASELLQGVAIERVPRNLARAITRNHQLDPRDEPALRDLILDVMGDPGTLTALQDAIGVTTPG